MPRTKWNLAAMFHPIWAYVHRDPMGCWQMARQGHPHMPTSYLACLCQDKTRRAGIESSSRGNRSVEYTGQNLAFIFFFTLTSQKFTAAQVLSGHVTIRFHHFVKQMVLPILGLSRSMGIHLDLNETSSYTNPANFTRVPITLCVVFKMTINWLLWHFHCAAIFPELGLAGKVIVRRFALMINIGFFHLEVERLITFLS